MAHVYRGRPLPNFIQCRIAKLRAAGWSVRHICRECDVSIRSVLKYSRRPLRIAA